PPATRNAASSWRRIETVGYSPCPIGPPDAPRHPRGRAREPARPRGGPPRRRQPFAGRALGRGGPRRIQSLAERGAAGPPRPPREGDPREPLSRRALVLLVPVPHDRD